MPKIKKGIKPVTQYHKIGNRRILPRFLYHAAKRENLESIKDFGLAPGLLKGIPGFYKDEDFIWLDTHPKELKNWLKKSHPDWNWVIIRVNTNYLKTDKTYMKTLTSTTATGVRKSNRWFIYKDNIPPEAISIVG